MLFRASISNRPFLLKSSILSSPLLLLARRHFHSRRYQSSIPSVNNFVAQAGLEFT